MADASRPLLRITGLTVRHGAALALDALELTIQPNEMFVLLGASGSGKTTLLRSIAGFIRPDAGKIELDGADLTGRPPHRRPVNTVFQSYALFPHLTVAGNVGFGLRHLPAKAAAARVAEMLALVRLEALADRRPDQLSGGQQQRVALARGLAPKPALLLLDEPLSALDRSLRAETREELVSLRRQLGTSFILVTHDQEEALTMADRIGVMQAGRMAQIGAPMAIYEHPNSRFVAEFLGAANILPVVVQTDGHTLALPGSTGLLRSDAAARPGPMLLALRPERLVLDGQADHQLTGTWLGAVYVGMSLMHAVRLPDGATVRVAQPLRDGGAVPLPQPGAEVRVGFSSSACILLPP